MRPRLPEPCLCLVTDRKIGDESTLVSRVAAAVAEGVDMVQLREKDLPGGRLLELASSLKDAVGDSALLIINERVDVAVAGGVAGVQLGEEALTVAAARHILGPEPLIGRSVHSEEGADQAIAAGADFLIAGPMYTTQSHPSDLPAGPELIQRIARNCPVPLFGIGGINALNVSEVLRAGAKGVAVITSILASPQPRDAARQLKQAMLAAWPADREVKEGSTAI